MHFFSGKTVTAAAVATVLGLASAATGADATSVSAGKLAKDAKKYYGQTVMVKAEVEDFVDARTFTLDEDSILAGADVLVLVPRGVTGSLARDQVVMVTGTVRQYVTADLDRDYDWFEDGKIVKRVGDKVDLKTRPVIVATSVRTADGKDVMEP